MKNCFPEIAGAGPQQTSGTIAHRNRSGQNRRGTLLLLVLITGTIICTISLGAILIQSLYLNQSTDQNSAIQARWTARSGIASGTSQISGSTTWRSSASPGTWRTGMSLSQSRWQLNVTDPTDTSFSDDAADPVQMTATGTLQNATQKATALYSVESVLRQPFKFLACANDDISCSGATIEGAGWIGCRDQLNVGSGSSVRTDVMTGSMFNGSGVTHRVLQSAIEALPQFSDFSDISAAGTSVSLAQVPSASAAGISTILNPDFGRGEVGWWVAPAGTLTTWSSGGVSNTSCAEISGRTSSSCGLVHDITGIIRNGLTTTVSAAVLPISTSAQFQFDIEVTTTNGTSTAASWTSSSVPAGTAYYSYRTLSTTLTPTWTDRLISARLIIRTSGSGTAGTQNFLADNVQLLVTSAPSGKAIYRCVVSSGTNPFGVTSNSSGIYVIDMNGADLVISDCMIVGTLIIRRAGTVTIGSGPVHWRPAKPGLPALIVDGDIVLKMSRFALTERELGINFNPVGTPDENGSQESNLNDSYRSWLRGICYASGDVTFNGDVVVSGCVLAGDDITFQQRTSLALSPEWTTVPHNGTHTSTTFLRDTSGVTRSFD